MNSRAQLKVFHSDNAVGASPSITHAFVKAANGTELPYGADQYSQKAQQQLSEIFETDVSLFLVATGTAANAISLAAMTPPWGSVLCHQESHINNDECGAPEFFCDGAKLIVVAGDEGRICADQLATVAQKKNGDVHSVQAAAVSISQTAENGSLYSLEELHAIGDVCKTYDLNLHMDGARFANALVSLNQTAGNVSPADMTWRAGVKALSFGGTKNGTFGVDAIVAFEPKMAQELAFRRKRAGHLMSKMRIFGTQMNAYLEDDLWLTNASHANAMARRLADGLSRLEGVALMNEQQSNILFCKLPQAMIQGLLEEGFGFYHDRWETGVIRLVTSFAHDVQDIDDFLAAAKTYT